jgi:hypothetical protein
VAEKQTKIALEGPHGEVETLWADSLGENRYRLDNLPWYAYRVSLDDVVEALPDSDGQLHLVRVVEKSGNRTIRLMCAVGESDRELTLESKQLLAGLIERGCSYEGANKVLVAVNVPPLVRLDLIAEYLVEAGVEWEYADPTYEDLFPMATDSPMPPMPNEG